MRVTSLECWGCKCPKPSWGWAATMTIHGLVDGDMGLCEACFGRAGATLADHGTRMSIVRRAMEEAPDAPIVDVERRLTERGLGIPRPEVGRMVKDVRRELAGEAI